MSDNNEATPGEQVEAEALPDSETPQQQGREEEAVVLLEEPIENGNDEASPVSARKGTVSSARFNLLSTMVGGGSLSLPLAFSQAGNGLLAPIILLVTACFTDFCFRLLVASAPPPSFERVGNSSFESIAKAAFGQRAHQLSTGLVCLMCFFGIVGYAVLLRDMLEPISDALLPAKTRWTRNMGMLVVVLGVTPLCGLKTLTSLEKFGATSMLSVLILGSCVMFRSFQCVHSHGDWNVRWLPDSPRQVLNSLPLFISCFVCHYNVLAVHNDLQEPTQKRVSWWLRSTAWGATAFYMAIGFSGSLYGACTPSGTVQGNVLLDFDPSDPLLMVGRMCLALTITLAFPMLTLPARDIMLRGKSQSEQNQTPQVSSFDEEQAEVESSAQQQLEEPLLSHDDAQNTNGDDGDASSGKAPSFLDRILVAILVFWSGAAVACCVSSIDMVWDFLGSSLSILLSYLIPCGSYLMLVKTDNNAWSRVLCWVLLVLFWPLMFISTGNAVMNTFNS